MGIVFVALLLAGNLPAQSILTENRERDSLFRYIQVKYGLDQELFNGTQYYQRYIQYKGDPYFPENEFYEGAVTVRGTTYEDVRLKYDCYAQHLVLEFTDFQNRYNQLNLHRGHTDAFRLGTLNFQKRSLYGEAPLFYQVLKAEDVTCFIHWETGIHTMSNDFRYTHEFTGPSGDFHLETGGNLHPFTSRKSFASLFPEPTQPAVRNYLRKNRISFKKPDPSEIQDLISFVAGQIETVSEK
jgi:hypothetical protein